MGRGMRLGMAFAAALAIGAAPAAVPAAAKRHTVRIAGKPKPKHRAAFTLRKLKGKHVVSAKVVHGKRKRPVPARKIAKAKRQGTITIAVPATPPAPPRPTTQPPPPQQPQPAPVLVVVVDDPPAAPAPADPPAADPPPADTPPSTSTPPSLPATPLAGATTGAPGGPILGDADAAAHVRRSSFEPRPENTTANHRVPTADELSAFRAASTNWGACRGFAGHITGNFTGTTDEILQWAAWKWGIDEDVLRAVASKETWWRQSFVGDNGESFGLMQVKRGVQAGTYPTSQLSTAFNVDYYASILRYYYDGCGTWLNDVTHGSTYAAGDLWGAVGAWYAGRWHTTAADGYIASVKANLAKQVWSLTSF